MLAPLALIVAQFFLISFLIALIPTIIVLACKVLFICCSRLKAACWNDEAESFKRKE